MVFLRIVFRYAFMFNVSWTVALLAAGCGGEAEEAAKVKPVIEEAIEEDAGSKIDVDRSGESVNIRGRGDRKDYSFAGGGKIKVPDGFAAVVSLYPGAELKMAQEQERRDMVAIFSTTDDRDRVLDFYRADAAAKGWKFMSEAVLEDEIFLGFAKEGMALTIAADPDGEMTIISISYKVKEL